jgi:hypothetical protein
LSYVLNIKKHEISTVSVVINELTTKQTKQGVEKALSNEHLLTQLAALSLFINVFLLFHSLLSRSSDLMEKLAAATPKNSCT